MLPLPARVNDNAPFTIYTSFIVMWHLRHTRRSKWTISHSTPLTKPRGFVLNRRKWPWQMTCILTIHGVTEAQKQLSLSLSSVFSHEQWNNICSQEWLLPWREIMLLCNNLSLSVTTPPNRHISTLETRSRNILPILALIFLQLLVIKFPSLVLLC